MVVEVYVFFFYKKTSPTTQRKVNLYSLNTLSYKKDYFNWLEQNNLITRSKFEVDNKGKPFLTNDTEGLFKSVSVSKANNDNKVTISIQTKEGLISFTFNQKDLEVYTKDRELIKLDLLKKEDLVQVHEVFSIQGEKIVPLNAKIVKST